MNAEPNEGATLKFDHWCIVELMGHQRIAGRVTEQNLFGGALMRVDVPEVDGRPGFTKFYGASAIYAVTPVEESVVRALAKAYDVRPVEEWRLQRLMSPAEPQGVAAYAFNGTEEDEFNSDYEEDDERDEEDAQWNANRAADMFGADGVDDDGNEYVELQ